MKTLLVPFLGPVTFDVVFNLGLPNQIGATFRRDRKASEDVLELDLWDRTVVIWRPTN